MNKKHSNKNGCLGIRKICYTFMQMPNQPNQLLRPLINWTYAIANTGITNKLSVHEKSKVRVINVSVFAGTPINFIFCIVNLLGHRPILFWLDLLLTLGGLLVLFLNKWEKFFLARIVLICGASLLFFACSILYRNGGEAAILALMIISVAIFEKRSMMICVTLFNFILYILVKVFLLSPIIFYTIPKGRILFNSLWSLFSVTISLIYLRKEQEVQEEKIEKNLRDLARLNSEKTKLFSIIAHDLRSPIGQLKTLIDLVNEKQISIDTFKMLTEKLALEVDQLHETMDSLLKWSMNQLHGIKANPRQIAVLAEFDQVINFFMQTAVRKNIHISREETEASVFADPDQLQLVLRNLVSNAIKYSRPDGIILLRAYVKDKELVIQVTDNGMGMTAATLQSLFSIDQFVSMEGTGSEKGTGLGLKLCKEFVEKNQGSISVESELNKGSTFSISLPQA